MFLRGFFRRFNRMDPYHRIYGPEWLGTVFRVALLALIFGEPIVAFFRWLWNS